ncbi:MAG TPA: hypothetical protein VMQ65_08665 [Candidatus Limnocylindria bacterium]|nr:hypothetical protein [Candidatus Limnocylindria bacterium]
MDRHRQRDHRRGEPEASATEECRERHDPHHVLDREHLAGRDEDEQRRSRERDDSGRGDPAPGSRFTADAPPADQPQQAEPGDGRDWQDGQPRFGEGALHLHRAEPVIELGRVSGEEAAEDREPAADRLDLQPALGLVRQEREGVAAGDEPERQHHERQRQSERQPVAGEAAGVERRQPRDGEGGHDREWIQLREHAESDREPREPGAAAERRPERDHDEQRREEVVPPRQRERGAGRHEDKSDRNASQSIPQGRRLGLSAYAGHRGRGVAAAAQSDDPDQHETEREHEDGLPAHEQPLVDLERDFAEWPEEVRHDHRDQRQRRVLERDVAVGELPGGERRRLLQVEPDVALVREHLGRRRQRRGGEDQEVGDQEQRARRGRGVPIARPARRHGREPSSRTWPDAWRSVGPRGVREGRDRT